MLDHLRRQEFTHSNLLGFDFIDHFLTPLDQKPFAATFV